MAKNIRADESILNPATSTGTSLRTTIPAWVVAKYDLRKGDKFRWHITETGFIVVEPLQEREEATPSTNK